MRVHLTTLEETAHPRDTPSMRSQDETCCHQAGYEKIAGQAEAKT